jgi:hypothetical protein
VDESRSDYANRIRALAAEGLIPAKDVDRALGFADRLGGSELA